MLFVFEGILAANQIAFFYWDFTRCCFLIDCPLVSLNSWWVWLLNIGRRLLIASMNSYFFPHEWCLMSCIVFSSGLMAVHQVIPSTINYSCAHFNMRERGIHVWERCKECSERSVHMGILGVMCILERRHVMWEDREKCVLGKHVLYKMIVCECGWTFKEQ